MLRHTSFTYNVHIFEIILLIFPIQIGPSEVKNTRGKGVLPVSLFESKACRTLFGRHLSFELLRFLYAESK